MADNLIQEKTENRIIDLVNLGAGGRLVISRQNGAENGLMVEKRGDYKKMPVFLKIFPQDFLLTPENFSKIATGDFSGQDNVYLIFAHFDIVKQDVDEFILLAPALEWGNLKSDDFQKFLINKKDIGKFLVNKLEK